MNHLPSLSKKLTFGDLFRQTFPPLAPAGFPCGRRRKETLLRKTSVAGFGIHLEGFGTPSLSKEFFDSLNLPERMAYFSASICRASPGSFPSSAGWTESSSASQSSRRLLGTLTIYFIFQKNSRVL